VGQRDVTWFFSTRVSARDSRIGTTNQPSSEERKISVSKNVGAGDCCMGIYNEQGIIISRLCNVAV
jgi:hypothetical protein